MSDAKHDDHGGHDHGDDHGHGHGSQSRFIQHHYDDAQHQFDSGKFGIWLFLAQEVLFFSALFVAYVLYRVHHPEIYSYAHKWLDVKYGATNTAVLIFSSLTAAWAVRAAQLGQRRLLILCLATTIVCACAFLCIKYVEYHHKWKEQALFGHLFDPCVTPGGEELITKKNHCDGTKSSVDYDMAADKPTSGCFEISKLDLDPNRVGIQADCQVTEVQISKDSKGKDVEGASRPITDRCDDELVDLLEKIEGGGHAGDVPTHETAGAESADEKAHHQKFPCWRPSYQPAVCQDLTDSAKRAQGQGSKPTAGILVEYGDDEVHRDVKIKATCKAPATVAPVADPMADKANVLAEGVKAVDPAREISTHEEFELESLGPPPEHTSMFLTIYFAMTGLHGIHVFVGIIVFIWLLRRAIRGDFTPDYFGPVDFSALYWHIVDLIWIFLFPLLYLIH
ncbi:MAG TPA: cytochrome c oxidase subunit 3 [Kofleriaceae bacterium]|jgi:cytochrome c oxidase subunit 3